MKKLMFVAVLCISFLIANAQNGVGGVTKETTKTEKMSQKPVKTMLKEAELMQPIKDDITKNYMGAKIEKALKIDSKGVVTYKVIIMKDNEKWDLTYDKDGKFIKKAEKKKMEGKKAMKKTEEAPK
jgi:hypothetical protein